jgi:serine O-acetyltransferase
VRLAARCDLSATRARDPACRTHADCLLYFKGYHSLQAYRIAHALHTRGQTLLATALQSRISEVFAVDIHPAARIGRGILLDHGTGVVIGETAVVGDRVSILQGVTLGGTGKESGDRHPKIGEGVLIGAHATILGNIRVGEGAMIAAGSLVLKSVAAHVMVAGAPAKEVGRASDWFPSLGMRQDAPCAEWAEGQGEGGAGAAGSHATGS